MSASVGRGKHAGLLFSLGSMNDGDDVHGDVEVNVILILGGRELVAVIGWRVRFASE